MKVKRYVFEPSPEAERPPKNGEFYASDKSLGIVLASYNHGPVEKRTIMLRREVEIEIPDQKPWPQEWDTLLLNVRDPIPTPGIPTASGHLFELSKYALWNALPPFVTTAALREILSDAKIINAAPLSSIAKLCEEAEARKA